MTAKKLVKNISARIGEFIEIIRKNLMDYAWWEIAFFIIGLISIISVFVILFFPTGKGRTSFTFTGTMPAATSTEFVRVMGESLNLPVQQGQTPQLINNGDNFLKSLLADIDQAHTSITIMDYIWADGRMSDQVFDHLLKKQEMGVQVRILIDGFGSSTGRPQKRLDELEKTGGKYAVFQSLTITPWELLRNRVRNHRRAIAIDDSVAYIGGMAINDLWLGDARNSDEYRDTMYRVHGSMVNDVQAAFNQSWTSMTGEALVGSPFFSQKNSTHSSADFYISLLSTPSPDSLTLQRTILQSIYAGHQHIYLTTPYFLPDESLRKALIEKAREGVDVRILVPGDHTDIKSVRFASRYSYADLLDAGVKIYEYNDTFIHAKGLVIDGAWSVIGSANMDFRSRNINQEFILGIWDTNFGATLEKTFLDDSARSTEISPSEWKDRGLWERWRELFALKFVQQY